MLRCVRTIASGSPATRLQSSEPDTSYRLPANRRRASSPAEYALRCSHGSLVSSSERFTAVTMKPRLPSPPEKSWLPRATA